MTILRISIHHAVAPLVLLLGACAPVYENPAGDGTDTCFDDGDCSPMETETGLVELQEGECVTSVEQNGVGVWHQCIGDVELDIEFDYTGGLTTKNCADFEDLLPDPPNSLPRVTQFWRRTVRAS